MKARTIQAISLISLIFVMMLTIVASQDAFVETVSLHIHERISTQAILRAVQKQPKQLELFADPKLPLHEAVEFYQHDMDWTNRLILAIAC